MSLEIGSVGTAYVELQADLSTLESQLSEAVQDAGRAGTSAGRAFGQGVGAGVNLSPVTAQLGLFEEATNQVATSAQQMGLAFHESSVIAVAGADSMAAAVATVATETEAASTGLVSYAAGLESSRAGITRFGSEAQNLGMILSVGVTLPLAGLAAASIKAFADIDSLKRGLFAVAGSAEEAKKQFADMQEVAKLPGLGLEEAIQGSIRLQAFGFSAAQSKEALLAFGNAIATVGGGKAELDRVIVQLGQMAGAGKVLQQDLRPIIEQVPQVASIIKKSFGEEAIGQPEKALEKLGLSSKQFIQTLVTELGKLPAVTGGIKNDMENMSDAIKLALADIGAALAPAFHEITEVAVPAIQAMVHAFTALPVPIQSTIIAVAGVAAAMGPALTVLGFMTKGYADLVGMVNLAASAFKTSTVAIEAVTVAQGITAAAAGTATTAIELENAAVILSGEDAEAAAARLVAFSEAEMGIGTAAGIAAGSAGAGGIAGLAAALGDLAGALALPGIGLLLLAALPAGIAKMVEVLDPATVAIKKNAVALTEQASILTLTHSLTDQQVKDMTDVMGLSMKVAAGKALLTKGAQDLIKQSESERQEWELAKLNYQSLLDAQARGVNVGNALALAHDKVTAAFKKLNPEIKENEKAQKAATEALKADSAERNKQDQTLLTIFDQKKKALAELETAQKEATAAGKADLAFTDQLETAKNELKRAFDNLNLAVQQNYVEQLKANAGTKQAGDVQEKQTEQVGKLSEAQRQYVAAMKAATQQQAIQQLALSGSFSTVEHGIEVFHNVGVAMQEAAKAGTLTWPQVQKSIESVRDSFVRVPGAIDGVVTSIEVMRGQGVQKISSLADAVGGLKATFLSVSDALNGTQNAVPQWVLNNTVAIVNGVHVVSDAAKALFADNAELAKSQEKVAGAQQSVNEVMIAGQQVMVTSNTVTSSATSATQDLAAAARDVAAGFTKTADASGAAVAGINKVAAAARAARNAFDTPSTATGPDWTNQGDAGFTMNGPINGGAGISFSTDRQTIINTALALYQGTTAWAAAAQMQYQDYIAAQKAEGEANLAAAATVDRNTASVISNTAAVAESTKQSDAAIPTVSDLTDQLWRLVDAGQGSSSAAWALRAQISALQTTTVATSNAYHDATAAATRFGTAIADVAETAVAAATITTAAAQSTKAALGIVSAPTPTPVSAAPTGSTTGLTILNPDTWYTTGGNQMPTINVYGQTAAAVGQQVTQILRAAGMG